MVQIQMQSNHFCSLKIWKQYGKSDDWSECLLLENQLGFKLSQSDKLCANHWYTPEVGYKQFKRCQHQHHQTEIGKKAPATRSVPISRCISIAEKNVISDWDSVMFQSHEKWK